MSNVLTARVNIAKRLNVMVRRIEDTAAFLLVGSNDNQPEQMNVVLAASNAESVQKVFTDADFLIKNFLKPADSSNQDVADRIYADYDFNGFKLNLISCDIASCPETDWYVCFLDNSGMADKAYEGSQKYDSDPVVDGIIPKQPEPEQPVAMPEIIVAPEPIAPMVAPEELELNEQPVEEEFVDDFDQDIQPEPEQPIEEPAPEPIPEPVQNEQKPEPTADEMWEHIYSRVSVAKRAIAGGSVFYAIDIVNELRGIIVQKICQKNGITSDYSRSIDLVLPNEARKALVKTFPASAEPGAVVAALAAELGLLEELI